MKFFKLLFSILLIVCLTCSLVFAGKQKALEESGEQSQEKRQQIEVEAQPDPFTCVPEEILVEIFSHLPFQDLRQAKQVCKKWYHFRKKYKKKLAQAPQMAAGGHHSLFQSETGEVWSVGWNQEGQLGLGNTQDQTLPQKVQGLGGQKVIQMAAGIYYSFFLSETGEVYSVGSNQSGQLGLGNQQDQTLPQKVQGLEGQKVIQMAAGYRHSLFLLDIGEVWSVGGNHVGQLGLGNRQDQTLPQKVQGLQGQKIIQMAAGYSHSLFLLETGEVYSVGKNENGQLGLGNRQDQTLPQKVQGLQGQKIIQMAAGYSHSLFLLETGEVYSVGKNENGQLGLGNEQDQTSLQLIFSLFKWI